MSADRRDRPLRPFSTFELWVVAILCLAFLLPGIWSYTLVDPWETHYGEVAVRMLKDHEWIHTSWQHEGFRSKPVFTFWLIAASLKAFGLAHNGGYSGEMVSSPVTMLALRLPFVLVGAGGLLVTWWMLIRLVSRRVAYLALIAAGSAPFYCLVSRQAITDIPLAACMMGAAAMFAMATEAGDEPIRPFARPFGIPIDCRHVFFATAGGFVAVQALYYFIHFLPPGPRLMVILPPWLPPAIILPGGMALLMAGLHRKIGPFWLLSLPPLLIGLAYAIRTTPVIALCGLGVALFAVAAIKLRHPFVRKLWRMTRLERTGQVYMLWFWALLGVSILAKGPPVLAVAGFMCALYVILLGRWKQLFDGAFEIKRGILVCVVVAIPWHVGMWMLEGRAFIHEYIGMHLLNRAAEAELGSKGTFDYYMSQIGYGMFIWAALLPAALAAIALRTGTRTRADRVRIVIALWAIASVAFFSVIQTKFHHYILPGIPAFAILVAFWLDDVAAHRARFGLVFAVVSAAIVLLVARDLMDKQEGWINMFVFRYDRPWPTGAPWSVNASDGFLALGLAGAGAILLLGVRRLRGLGVWAVAGVGLATGLWAMHAYMPVAATHWGMRDEVRHYYRARQIYGERLVYYGAPQLEDAWQGRTTWTIHTFVPDALEVGQPMTVQVTLRDWRDKTTLAEVTVHGEVTEVRHAALVVTLDPHDVDQVHALARRYPDSRAPQRDPIEVVDAERLIAWQLYWRGEVFWSGDEIWGPLPDLRSDWQLETNNVQFHKYLNDPTMAPPGRRYFVITEAGRISSLKSALTTARAKETFTVLDTTSNKFTLASFVL